MTKTFLMAFRVGYSDHPLFIHCLCPFC